MQKWSGRQNNGNHPIRTARRKIKIEKFKASLRQYQVYQHSHNRGPRGEEREKGQKGIWWNYEWKLSKPEEGNRYPDTGNTEDPTQDEPK